MKKYILVICILLFYWYIFDISISNLIITAIISIPAWIFPLLISYIGIFIGAKIYRHEIFYFRFIFIECYINDGKWNFNLCKPYFDKHISIKPNDKDALGFIYFSGEIFNIIVGIVIFIFFFLFFSKVTQHYYLMLGILLFAIFNIGFGIYGLLLQCRNKRYSYLKAVKDEDGLVAARSIFKMNYNLATTKELEDIDEKYFTYTENYWNNYFESYIYLLNIERLICLEEYDEAFDKIKNASLEMNKHIKLNIRHYEIFLLIMHFGDFEKASKLYKSSLIKNTSDYMNTFVVRNKILYELIIEGKSERLDKHLKYLNYYTYMRRLGFREIEERLNKILEEKIDGYF